MDNRTNELDVLYAKYHLLVYKIAYIITRNRTDSEDITQELFIKLCYNSPNFKSDEHERAWIIRVTQNLSKNLIKKAYRRRETGTENFYAPSENKQDETLSLIMELPVKYKTIVVLYYYAGYSVDEIAVALRLGVSNVKARLMRAREQLRIKMEDDLVD